MKNMPRVLKMALIDNCIHILLKICDKMIYNIFAPNEILVIFSSPSGANFGALRSRAKKGICPRGSKWQQVSNYSYRSFLLILTIKFHLVSCIGTPSQPQTKTMCTNISPEHTCLIFVE